MLTDYDMGKLSFADKWLFVALVMLACQLKNKIPADREYVARRIGSGPASEINIKPLMDAGLMSECDESVSTADIQRGGEVPVETRVTTSTPRKDGATEEIRLEERRGDSREARDNVVVMEDWKRAFNLAAWQESVTRDYPAACRGNPSAVSRAIWSLKEPPPLADEMSELIEILKKSKKWRNGQGRYIPALQNFITNQGWQAAQQSRSKPEDYSEESWTS